MENACRGDEGAILAFVVIKAPCEEEKSKCEVRVTDIWVWGLVSWTWGGTQYGDGKTVGR